MSLHHRCILVPSLRLSWVPFLPFSVLSFLRSFASPSVHLCTIIYQPISYQSSKKPAYHHAWMKVPTNISPFSLSCIYSLSLYTCLCTSTFFLQSLPLEPFRMSWSPSPQPHQKPFPYNLSSRHILVLKLSKFKFYISKIMFKNYWSVKFLKKWPAIGIKFLTQLFNAVLFKGYFPAQWKVAQIILILTPGKPPNELTSYRPISLLPIVSKVFEKILL
jgi:hypothetical protein